MYIVKKNVSGHDYYYLNKSIREGDKVISKNVAYLGKDKKEAEEKAKEIIEQMKKGEKINKPEIKNNEMDEEKQVDKKISNDNIEEKLTIDELASFCKKKGFVFKSSEIYGGMAGFWDFGPLGVELFNNIKQDWWNFFVKSRENMVGMEASIISHPKTWEASGHIQNFNDIFVKCKKCGKSRKLDENELGKVKCDCGGEYESQGKFNLMFETKIGSIDPETAYLRGETAQAMFMNFKLIQQVSRQKLPFGIAQIGRCFRNEISPRDFLFRSREFHIGEFEFFINPEETKCKLLEKKHLRVKVRLLDEETQKKRKEELKETTIEEMLKQKKLGEWHAYWLAEQVLWFNGLGLNEIKIREHTKDELSHYSSATFDIDYEYVFGSKEVAGNANRGQYDLKQHEKFSKEKMEVFDEETSKKVIPRVIEPTFGMERVFLAILTKAYNYDKKRQNIVLKIPAKLAPIKAAVFPIVKQPEYEKISEEIVKDLKKEFNIVYDKSGSIGKRYSRNDEIGTIMCITVDDKTLKDKTVTLRDRDTTEQVRVKISDLKGIMRKIINEGESVLKFGKKVNTRIK
jgi:glycyl-tRNA synthetase